MNQEELYEKLNLEEKRLVQRTKDAKIASEISSLLGSIMTIQKIKKWIK